MQEWLISSFVCAFVIGCAVSLPATTVETDRVTTSPNSEVPREFPNFNQNYTFVDNSSIRANLASHSDIDTEVDDLLGNDLKESGENPPKNEQTSTKNGENDDTPKNEEEENKDLPKNETVPNPPQQDDDLGRKGVFEWIEDGDDTEDNKFVAESNQPSPTTEEIETSTISDETTTEKKIETTEEQEVTETGATTEEIVPEVDDQPTTEKITSEPYKYGIPLIDGSVAAILVGTFLVICVFGYTALILWRRSLELKYGSREMLVDKDDFFDPDDLKHFSI